MSCNRLNSPTEKSIKFKVVDINIAENGTFNILNCAKWYIDFSRIKRSVIYEDKVICVGFNGGFACLNSSDLKQDTALEKKMNTDFFTNATVYQDTLFAEKFNQLYFWNSEKWIKYLHEKPIKYFDLLFEDNHYAFYSSCMGEFGSILFVYDKTRNITRAELTTCPNSVIKTDSGYNIGAHLYHMAGSSYSYTIRDIEKLRIVPDSIRLYEGMFDRDSRLSFLQDTTLIGKNNYSAFKFFYPKDVMIVSSFSNEKKLYHIIDPRDFRQVREKRLIGSVENDTLKIIDSLKDCAAETAIQFRNITIINEEFYGNGFTLIRNDTIFKITFTTKHTGYQGPKFEEYNFTTDSSKKLTAYKEYTYNEPNEDDWTLKPGLAEREIKFSFGKKYKIVGYYGNAQDGNYIYTNATKTRLKFKDQWNFLKNIFTYDNRLFLFFGNLGNTGFKYGLIEITDIDKFTAIYKE